MLKYLKYFLVLSLLFIVDTAKASNIDSLKNEIKHLDGVQKLEAISTILLQTKSSPNSNANLIQEYKSTAYKLNNIYYIGRAFMHEGLFYFDTNLPYAYQCWLKSLDCFKQCNDSLYLTKAYSNLGIVLKAWGNYTSAIEHYKLSLKYIPKNDSSIISTTYYNMAVAYNKLSISTESLDYLNLSEAALKPQNRNFGITAINYLRGQIYNTKGQLDNAKHYFDIAMKFADEYSILSIKIPTMNELAIVLAKKKEFNKADEISEKALQIGLLTKDKKQIILTKCSIGHIKYLEGKYSEAIINLEEALKGSVELTISIHTDYILEYLHKSYLAKGNVKKAYQILQRRFNFNDSLYKADVLKGVLNVENQIRIEKQVSKIKLLENDNKINSLTISNQNTFILAFLCIILLLLIIIFLAYFYYKKVKRLNNKLEINNQAIEDAKFEIETQLSTVEEQKTQLQEYVIELNNTKSELEKSNSLKDRLFSIIAHDLKGPIGNLGISLRYLIDFYYQSEDAERIEMLEAMHQSSIKIVNLLLNLLGWSSLQRHNTNLLINKNEFIPLVEMSISSSQSIAKSNKIDIIYNSSSPTIICDSNIISTIIRNLVSNSIKHLHTNGVIEIQAIETDTNITISVNDNGKGMSAEMIQNIIHRKVDEINQKSSSTGIGLMICQELIEIHKGELKIESELGVGTTVILTIPKQYEDFEKL